MDFEPAVIRRLKRNPRRRVNGKWVGAAVTRPELGRKRGHNGACVCGESRAGCPSMITIPVPVRTQETEGKCAWLAICNAIALLTGNFEAAIEYGTKSDTRSRTIPMLDAMARTCGIALCFVSDTKGKLVAVCAH